jgi:hypothetical protein
MENGQNKWLDPLDWPLEMAVFEMAKRAVSWIGSVEEN